MSTIQIRIDQKTKEAAKQVLDILGLDMSSAIKVFLRQVALQKKLPFPLLTENGLTPAEEQAILATSKEATQGKHITSPMTPQEALSYLKKL